MTRVRAIILHPVPSASGGALERAYTGMRLENARRLADGFGDVGATPAVLEVDGGGPSFGERLRDAVAADPDGGLIVLGSGSIPLATNGDLATFVGAAGIPGGPILVNNLFSADIVALPSGIDLSDLPDLVSDNALPRWLAGRGLEVRDLRGRTRLQFDLDSPVDGLVAGLRGLGPGPGLDSLARGVLDPDVDLAAFADAWRRLRSVAADPGAELLVAGRTSAATLRWLERRTRSRTRAFVEERGFRTARPGQRPPRSLLGTVLDDRGPAALGGVVAELADAAVIDSRVLLAHRLGADERAWPGAEDRFASDLLLPDRIADPWLEELTRAALEAAVPILLVGHTLVGPGLPTLLGARARR